MTYKYKTRKEAIEENPSNAFLRFNRKPEKVAVGYRHHGSMRLNVAFDDEAFAAIRARAIKEGTTAAEQVRQLVEWGLMCEESEIG